MKPPVRGPLRRVVEIRTLYRPYTQKTSKGRIVTGQSSYEVEVLECGHHRTPKPNEHFGGTDVGERDRRRCPECSTTKEGKCPENPKP